MYEHLEDIHIRPEPFEFYTAGVEEIRVLLMFFASAGKGPASGRGCLLCNTAVEFGSSDPCGGQFVQGYFEHVSKAFYKALNNAHHRGELRDDVSIREEADYFTASTLGLFVMIRAEPPSAMIESAARMAIEHLEELCI